MINKEILAKIILDFQESKLPNLIPRDLKGVSPDCIFLKR